MLDITPASALRNARARAGLSQRALAQRAHTTQAVVARIESGTSDPAFSTFSRLLRAAGFGLGIATEAPLPAEPVIEAYKAGVDRTLLIENLRRSVTERLRVNADVLRVTDELRRAKRVAERKK